MLPHLCPAHSQRLRRAILGALMLGSLGVVAGCVHTPPGREAIQAEALPGVNLPGDWHGQPASGEHPAEPLQSGWVAHFDDPTLHALVAEAVANNRDLAVAASRVDQASAAVDVAQAQLNPAVGLLTRVSSRPLSDLATIFSGAVFKAVWEIDLWGKLRYARNAAEAMHLASVEDYRGARQSIAAATAKAWFLLRATAMQQQLGEAMVDNAEELVTLAGQRLKVGAGTEKDLALARASLSSYQDALQQVHLAHRQSARALEILLGRYPAAELRAQASLPPFPAAVPVGTPVGVLERRPDLVAAQRRVDAAFNRVGEAKRALLPSLSLSANVGWVDDDQNASGSSDISRSLGAQAYAPLYTGGALMGGIDLRTHEQKQAVLSYGRIALHAMGEVENALDAENQLRKREASLQEALRHSRRALVLEQESYRVGRSDLRAVTQAQFASHAAALALLQVQRERLDRRVDLHLALGGDFEAAPRKDRQETGGAGSEAPGASATGTPAAPTPTGSVRPSAGADSTTPAVSQ